MLIQQVENPRCAGRYEDIVTITMTKDQFHHLKDCVTLAFQHAEKDSRMFLITTMIKNEFDNLKVEEKRNAIFI